MNTTNLLRSTLVPLLALGLMSSSPAAPARGSPLASIDDKLDTLIDLAGGGAAADPGDHVMLRSQFNGLTSCPRERAYHRMLPDGTVEASEFQVPAGHVLLLTDVSWSALHQPTNFDPGRTLSFNLESSNPDGTQDLVVYSAPPVEITTNNQNARLGGAESLRAGVLVGAGRIVCAHVANVSQSGGALNTTDQSFLRGVLLPVTP